MGGLESDSERSAPTGPVVCRGAVLPPCGQAHRQRAERHRARPSLRGARVRRPRQDRTCPSAVVAPCRGALGPATRFDYAGASSIMGRYGNRFRYTEDYRIRRPFAETECRTLLKPS